MTFLLSSKNVFEYLLEHGVCTQEQRESVQIEPKLAKNFNLLLTLSEGRQILVKQEPHNRDGKTAGEFLRERRIHQFFQQFSEVRYLQKWLPDVCHFDADHSIIVIEYLDDHRDLSDFYVKENAFPTAIATSIGTVLATIHQLTLNQQSYHNFLSHQPDSAEPASPQIPNLTLGLERIAPEVFGQVPIDGLRFFALYQRYDSLPQAIIALSQSFKPCCLTHNDLKLNNILLPNDWEAANNSSGDGKDLIHLRLIDWERANWGDPAFDLGSIIASYLGMWLGSLVASKSMAIEESLRLAMIPLDTIQPTLVALLRAYFAQFPEMLEYRPDFFRQVMQFAGLGLIQSILSMIQYQKTFGNTGVCMLQVAKTLLCRPQDSIPTVFGVAEAELTQTHLILA
ncbi:aminoglycoside phosphotransferase family protein [Oculatella sp. LEGE 06141]|uniref:phosphotransferase family protein n=1 Tax=Oculatella sp. LEGE 06141 TaxID=1828648 RepID=UPI001881121C|nr:phosphotransferase [Oculatella sp. LEGE 06141]MBE9181627.1 aminoglycoside phosphotransferase family protein [Oculatella sp. LEGE 06141]